MIRLLNAKGASNIRRNGRRGRGGEGEHGLDAEFFGYKSQTQVFRAEIVAPLGDAVRFIDRHHRDFEALEPLDEVFIHEPLWGDVEQLQRAVAHVVEHLRCFVSRER